jgi:MFS/sugar transport protein
LRLPLALLELPLFVVLPALYGSAGLTLSLVGAVLFGARCVDAAADPLIGLWLARQRRFVHRRWILAALPVLAAGFWALLHPPGAAVGANLALWLGLWSIATYIAYSLASIAYQAWGTDLGENAASRTAGRGPGGNGVSRSNPTRCPGNHFRERHHRGWSAAATRNPRADETYRNPWILRVLGKGTE